MGFAGRTRFKRRCSPALPGPFVAIKLLMLGGFNLHDNAIRPDRKKSETVKGAGLENPRIVFVVLLEIGSTRSQNDLLHTTSIDLITQVGEKMVMAGQDELNLVADDRQ